MPEPAAVAPARGDITVTNKTGTMLYYKSSGPCTAWAPDTTVTLTHRVGKHLSLWLDSSCHSTQYCGNDFDTQTVLDNSCKGNCKTKIVTGAVGTTGAYQCGISPGPIFSFVDN